MWRKEVREDYPASYISNSAKLFNLRSVVWNSAAKDHIPNGLHYAKYVGRDGGYKNALNALKPFIWSFNLFTYLFVRKSINYLTKYHDLCVMPFPVENFVRQLLVDGILFKTEYISHMFFINYIYGSILK